MRESIAEQLARLQKQHDEFVEHIGSMIHLLDARLEKLTEEARERSDSLKVSGQAGPTRPDSVQLGKTWLSWARLGPTWSNVVL